MKVICDRGALLEAINLVSGVVASRTPRQQLTCVHLSARKVDGVGRLTLAATDAEIALRLDIDNVSLEREGSALVPADKLRQIVSAEDHDTTLTLDSDGDSLEIRGVDATFKILGYPPAEFPAIPEFSTAAKAAKAVFSQSAGTLTTLVARTLFATARENSRYAINGVLLKQDGKRLELVATDGRRLAIARAALPSAEKDAPAVSCIIPSKALNTLQRLASDPEEPVRIAVTDNQAVFMLGADDSDGGRACLSTNLVEGTFPPYEDVVPKDQDKSVLFDRDVMSSAVKRAALLTNEESRGVRLSFNGADKQLELSSRAPEMGEATVTVDLVEYKGDDMEVGFNPGYLVEALKVIDDPQVIMELKSTNKPGVIKSGNEFLYVVMPVTLT
ncbi:MAG: DNA polymerase III subunit beta [Phycisphaerales bacterium JB037]